jgi:excisionase family DNA binding protein
MTKKVTKPQRRTGDLPDNWRELPTLTIEQARKLLNLSRNAAYEAAKRREFPVERFGKVWRVPVPKLRQLLGEAA